MKLISYRKPRLSRIEKRLIPVALILTFLTCGAWIFIYFESVVDLRQPIFVYSAESDNGCEYEVNGNGEVTNPKWMQQLFKQSSLPPILGHRSQTKKFLSIGVSSVYREENYLEKTLDSFILETCPDERENAVVVVFLADKEPRNKEKQLNLIRAKFQPYLDSGFIQVIGSTPDIYPPMNFALTKRTFNDPVDRVLWRTKQVIDFAFLLSYIKSQSEYHVVVEDDIIAAPQFITCIQEYVESKRSMQWIALHFSQFLGIGLLFHSRELAKLSQFLIMFHQDQPVDMLLRKYIQIENSEKNDIMRREPSIFQHIGIKSTLPNKVQALTDGSFNVAQRQFRNRNPRILDIVSSMRTFQENTPRNAYAGTPGYFWGVPSKMEETFDIVFQNPTVISRLIIISGLLQNGSAYAKDPVQIGSVEVSTKFISVTSSRAICEGFHIIGNFSNGSVDIQANLRNIRCIRLKITPLMRWIIIREIEIIN